MHRFAASDRRILSLMSAAQGRLEPMPRVHLLQNVTIAALMVGFLIFALTTDGFLTVDNGRAILASMALVGIVAIGMTFITLSGNIFSLSLGIAVAVGAMMFLFALQFGLVVALGLTLILGIVIGATQGFTVGAWGANPIIVTIAAGAVMEGVAVALTEGQSLFPPEGARSHHFLTETYIGLPFSFYAFALLAVGLEVALRNLRVGRELLLVGENRHAAAAAGLPVTKVTVTAFGVAGGCAAIAGILAGSLNENATLQVQGTFTFDAIAATLVGGNAIAGGRGSVLRTVMGALIIAVVSDVLLLRGYPGGIRTLVTGVIIVTVVLAVHLRSQERRG
jgi:ribose/xylose/arabinose/galactoside ABC-type transport system permease subunit